MADVQPPYVTRSPVGCDAPLKATDIFSLPEGPLRRCNECGQLLSAVNESEYCAPCSSSTSTT